MLTALEFFAGALFQLLWIVLVWLVGFPVVWLVSLPFILLRASFSRKTYRDAVFDMIAAVSRFWAEWGLAVFP